MGIFMWPIGAKEIWLLWLLPSTPPLVRKRKEKEKYGLNVQVLVLDLASCMYMYMYRSVIRSRWITRALGTRARREAQARVKPYYASELRGAVVLLRGIGGFGLLAGRACQLG